MQKRNGRSEVFRLFRLLIILLVVGAIASFSFYLSTNSRLTNTNNQNAESVIPSAYQTGSTQQASPSIIDPSFQMTLIRACVSEDDMCSGSGYSIKLMNTGENVISKGSIDIFFTIGEIFLGKSICRIAAPVQALSPLSCNGSVPSSLVPNSSVELKLVFPDGQSYTKTTTVVASPQVSRAGLSVNLARLDHGVTDSMNRNQSICVLIGGFDQSSCVTASSGHWTNSALGLAIWNPGTATAITGLTLTGQSIGKIISWSSSSSSPIAISFGEPQASPGANSISATSVTTLTYYPITSVPLGISVGQVCNYTINFANGQNLTGSVIAE